MSEPGTQRHIELLQFYQEHRIDDQMRFYRSRLDQFDRASGQGLFVSAMILSFASAAGALAGTAMGWSSGWAAVAAILSALSTALAGYLALYAFDLQSKIYGDAVRAVRAAARPGPDPSASPADPSPQENVADLVKRVEQALRQEQAQWGQIASQSAIRAED